MAIVIYTLEIAIFQNVSETDGTFFSFCTRVRETIYIYYKADLEMAERHGIRRVPHTRGVFNLFTFVEFQIPSTRLQKFWRIRKNKKKKTK